MFLKLDEPVSVTFPSDGMIIDISKYRTLIIDISNTRLSTIDIIVISDISSFDILIHLHSIIDTWTLSKSYNCTENELAEFLISQRRRVFKFWPNFLYSIKSFFLIAKIQLACIRFLYIAAVLLSIKKNRLEAFADRMYTYNDKRTVRILPAITDANS